jgi:hypothetical protein
LRLYGGGYGVTLVRDCAEQLGREAEIRKSANEKLLGSAREGVRLPNRFRQMLYVEKFGNLGRLREGAETLTG